MWPKPDGESVNTRNFDIPKNNFDECKLSEPSEPTISAFAYETLGNLREIQCIVNQIMGILGVDFHECGEKMPEPANIKENIIINKNLAVNIRSDLNRIREIL